MINFKQGDKVKFIGRLIGYFNMSEVYIVLEERDGGIVNMKGVNDLIVLNSNGLKLNARSYNFKKVDNANK